MILDPESWELANAIEALLEESGGDDDAADIKPELHESVLEIATKPCRDVREAGAELRGLRRQVAEVAAKRDLTIGSAGTHPFALWEDQRISARPRYRDLIEALRFVARQEVIFGLHVHVGIDDADKAIHVANGMRVHAGLLLALSANSPFWRGDDTGPGLRPDADLPPVPARRDAARLRGLGRLRAPHRLHGRLEGDGGLHLPLVRRPPAPELRDGRDPRDGRADAGRAHARARGADPGDGQGAGRALRGRRAARRLPVRDARREPLDRRAPRPRRRARRPPELRAGADEGSSRGASTTGSPSTRRTSARPPSSRASSTCWRAATAPRARRSSTRPTTTSTRSCARSRRPRCPSKRATFGAPLGGRVESLMWPADPSSSSSARSATPRCRRTSRSALTAAPACASARPSSRRAAARRARRAGASGRSSAA